MPMVDADSRRLRWALINMVRNAWQYTPEGGEVTLRSSLYDGKVVVDVVDTGIGISLEDQERIFDRFKRIDQESDDIVRGLGLGLYISNAIVEAHGGKIEIASEEGAGSTFSVILPTLQSGQGRKSPN
jgi:signal transduction histidine kinase